MSRLALATFLSILALSISSLTQVMVKDSFGELVPARHYERVVSLAPNLTEIVAYLGTLDSLVGVTDFCDFPPEVKDLPKVGGYIDPNVEAIVALKPEIVLAYRGNPLPVIMKLKEVGVPVFILDNARTLDELLKQMEDLATLLKAEDQARTKLRDIRKSLKAYRANLVSVSAKHSVLILTGTSPPFYAAGKNTVHDSIIIYAGGRNGFDAEGYAHITPEAILNANPDVIVSPIGVGQDPITVLAGLKSYPALFGTDAVRYGRVLFVEEDVLMRPGPRIFGVLERLSGWLRGLSGEVK